MTEIPAKVQQVKYQLPAGVTDPVISKSTEGGTAVQYVAFFSDTLTIPQITDFANRVAQPLFAGIPGVASVDINGGQTLALRIWIDPVKLAARGRRRARSRRCAPTTCRPRRASSRVR